MNNFEKKIYDLVRNELKDELLKDKYKQIPIKHRFFGHCHNASLAMYILLGGKEKGYKLRKAIDEKGITHYWLENKEGEIIDPTKEQYIDLNWPLPYKDKINRGISYLKSNAVKKIVDNVRKILNEKQ